MKLEVCAYTHNLFGDGGGRVHIMDFDVKEPTRTICGLSKPGMSATGQSLTIGWLNQATYGLDGGCLKCRRIALRKMANLEHIPKNN